MTAMKILVCTKVVPQPGDIQVGAGGQLAALTGQQVMNPFDAYAVEAALQLKDAHGGTVTVLAAGGDKAPDILREAIAMGADVPVHVEVSADGWSDGLASARVLAAAIRQLGGFDLILLGRQSTVGTSGQVGPMLAELLDIAHVTQVRSILGVTDEAVVVERQWDGGVAEVEARKPALLTVTKDIGEPRYPNFKGILRAKKTPIQTVTVPDQGGDGAPHTEVVRYTPAPPRAAGEILQGTLSEQVSALTKKLLATKWIGKEESI